MNPTLLSRVPSASGNCLKAISFALGILSLTLAHPVVAEQRGTGTATPLQILTVTGRGVETIPTTLTQVQLGVEVQGKTAADVQQEVARRSSALVELLRSRNVEKLQTTGISLNPAYTYDDKEKVQRLTGYVGTNIVSFRLDTQRVGNLLDAAVSAGATRINGLDFVASDSAIATAQQQALRKATQDAQKQANVVLSSLNLTLQKVVSIQVNGANAPLPLPLRSELTLRTADKIAVSTPVVGGEQQVEATVTLQISY